MSHLDGVVFRIEYESQADGVLTENRMQSMTKTITVRYFALFRERAGVGEERLKTAATTARDVFEATRDRHRCPEPLGHCKVAINDEMADWDSPVADGDVVLLFPPVAGG